VVDLAEEAKEAPIQTKIVANPVETLEMIVAARMVAVDSIGVVEEAMEMTDAVRMVVEEEVENVPSRMDRRGRTVVGAASIQAAVAVAAAMDVAVLDIVAMLLESMNVGSMGT
jgi:hypothetical protein